MKHVKQSLNMLPIVPTLSDAYIVYDNTANFLRAELLVQQIFTVSNRRHFRHVFMLGDGKHFFLCQAAKRETILKSNHNHIGPFIV